MTVRLEAPNKDNPGLVWLRKISVDELSRLGMSEVAYVKPVRIDGAAGYAIHAADGTAVAVVADRATAQIAVRQHDLEPVSVH